MTHDLSKFTNYVHIEHLNTYITIPDGSRVLVKLKGNVKLNDEIELHNVLHVPDFQFNTLI